MSWFDDNAAPTSAPGGSAAPDDWFAQQGAPGGGSAATPTAGGPGALDQFRQDPQALREIQAATGMSLETAQEALRGQNGPAFQAEVTRRLTEAGLLPPSAAGPSAGQTPGGGGVPGQDPEAYFKSLIAGKPGTPETLIGLESQLKQAGIKVLRNAAGVAGKIQLPNGQVVDVIRSAGTGGGPDNWQWLTGDGGGAAGGGGGGVIGAGLENTPGYQFRLGEGLKAIERSAAARGTLLTGGTLKGMQRYAQDVASTEYGNRVNQLQNLAELGLRGASGQAIGGSNYAGQAGNLIGNQATNQGNLITGQGNAQAAGTIGVGNAWAQGLGNAANLAQQYYLYQLMNGGGSGGGQAARQQALWDAGYTGPAR